jgi:hypothetical protein
MGMAGPLESGVAGWRGAEAACGARRMAAVGIRPRRGALKRLGVLALLIAAIGLFAGCGRSPEKVFGDLRSAAIAKDAKTVWANITPQTQKALADIRSEDSSGAAGSGDGLAELETLTSGLDSGIIEYIRTLRSGEVSITGDTALMSIKSARFGESGRTLTFRKIDGKWLWDGREILKAYVENRDAMHSWEGF